jgi:hypothetical protein
MQMNDFTNFGKIIILLIAYLSICLSAYANSPNKSGVPGTASSSTSAPNRSAKTSAQSYKAPEWWRRETMRRQYVEMNRRKRAQQEMKESTKAMWNPRSPQAMAYQRAYLLSHKDLQSHKNVTSKAKPTPQANPQSANPQTAPSKQEGQ